jgi:hypothetical protein
MLFETQCLYLTLPVVLLCVAADVVRDRVPDTAWPALLDRLKAWARGKLLAALAQVRRRQASPTPSAPRPPRAKLGWPFQREPL